MIAESTIQDIAGRLLAASPPGSRVILFGSYAKGVAREGSDLDFLVIEPNLADRHSETWRLTRVVRPLRIPIDLVVASEEAYRKWADTPSTIFNEASRYGKVFAA